MFVLSRSGKNVPAEVQRWQYFLRKQGFSQVGPIDASFGGNTELGTKMFQVSIGLKPNGKADKKTISAAEGYGYRVLNKDYYKERESLSWPPKPSSLKSPSNKWRNKLFDCFEFIQRPLNMRPDKESIVIKGNCSDSVNDWEDEYIINLSDDRFQFVDGYRGYIRCHRFAASALTALLDKWEEESLLHLVLNYAGCFVPRYKRNQAPSGTSGHSKRRSRDVDELSNHSFGSAIDISTTWNWIGETPARCGRKGSIRELVDSANNIGFYWGGHYNGTKDGMHFELTKL
ncbi:M15 family metallopeptidase [Ruegeria sp. Ofav3-42]|uniref:M15 family metallopeptidase n=1 Tax=Ruegeria sp. Ofav3-42 TaxID=2917759 RepID=UPI001EF672EB|nr:M15 family metallopeptidase [Ruegeria sp. Ofav3-42]MCG7518990.1 M15 family metallopeptidase [Ruegeria sp. Ofav3-42]